MRLIAVLVALALLCAPTSPAVGRALQCTISKKFMCEPREGCKTIATQLWNWVDQDSGSYSRCDKKGCDKYPATFHISGIYININVVGRGMLAKLAEDRSFTEVVTQGHAVLVSYGKCE